MMYTGPLVLIYVLIRTGAARLGPKLVGGFLTEIIQLGFEPMTISLIGMSSFTLTHLVLVGADAHNQLLKFGIGSWFVCEGNKSQPP